MRRRRATLRFRRPSRSTVVWIGAFAAAAALQVWVQLKTMERGYELGIIRQVLLRLAGEQAELEVELATLTSPRTLDRVARARLGLRSPAAGQVVGLP